MRKISIKVPALSNLVTFETSANTLAEFRNDVMKNHPDSGIVFENVKFVDIQTMNEFSMDEAVLPSGDLVLLSVPVKSKSGVDVTTLTDLDELGYNEARSLGSKLNKENNANLDLSGKRDDIVPRIKDYVESQSVKPSKEVEAVAKNLTTAIELLSESVEMIKGLDLEERKAIEYAIPGMTMDELVEKEREILKKIK